VLGKTKTKIMTKKIVFLALFITSIQNVFAQSEEREYFDTTFTTSFFNMCDEPVKIPKNVSSYLLNSPGDVSISIQYQGSCTVGDTYYECVRLHKAIISVRLYRFNNYKIKRDEKHE